VPGTGATRAGFQNRGRKETTGEGAERTRAAESFAACLAKRERMFLPPGRLPNAMRPIPSRKTGAVRRHAAPLSSLIVAPNDPSVFLVTRILTASGRACPNPTTTRRHERAIAPEMRRALDFRILPWGLVLVLRRVPLGLRSVPRIMDTFASRSQPPPGDPRDGESLDPSRQALPSPELAVALYEHMVVARVLDEKVVSLRARGVVTDYESSAGEEATIVGAVAGMNDEDFVFLRSRDVAGALWRGVPLSACAHRVVRTAPDSARGRSSSDPHCWKAARVASASPLAATHISHAVGFAWAARLRAADIASLVLFGEDATRCADYHCGLNFAGVSRAPVVAVSRASGPPTSSLDVATQSVAYGLTGFRVDGGDVIAVWNAVREARRRAAGGLGGTLVEATRSNPDLDLYADIDPVLRMRGHVERLGLWNDDRERHLQSDVRADVDRAFMDVAAARRPAWETQFEDVYAELPWHLREQRDG